MLRASIDPRPRLTLQTRVLDQSRALFAAMVALGLLELGVLVHAARPSAASALGYFAVTCAQAAWVALLVGALVATCAMAGAAALDRLSPSTRVKNVLQAHGFALLIAAASTGLARPWDLNEDPYHLTVVVPTVSALGTLIVAFAHATLRPATLGTLGLIASLLLFGLDATQYRGLYLTMHNVVGFWAIALTAVSLHRVVRHAIVGLTLGALAISAQLALVAPGDSRVLGALHGSLEPRLLGLLRGLLDRDADGASPLLSGGDCDDEDPNVHPRACERPETPHDDNCNGSAAVVVQGSRATVRTPRSPLPDVYLLLVDALRADFAFDGSHMPSLARLASQSLSFERAYTAYPSTRQALQTLLQSRSARRLAVSAPDLFGIAIAAGYDVRFRVDRRETSIVPSAQARLATRLPRVGLPKTTGKAQWTEQLLDGAIRELRDDPAAGPRFRWLHLLDVHAPLPASATSQRYRDRYARAARDLDAHLGRFFSELVRTERGRNAVLIVAGDHGEQLGEHGEYFHGSRLWNEQIHVPLVMRLPGVAARTVAAPASLIDLAPTLLSFLGLETPPSFEGHDWLTYPDARDTPPAAELTSTTELLGGLGQPLRHTLIGTRYKLSLNVSDNLLEVYDLERDPHELAPLRDLQAPEVVALRRALVRFQDEAGCDPR